MLQNFDNNAQPDQAASRLALVRLEMAKADIDGFIVPREDEFMGEYVPACGERRRLHNSGTPSLSCFIH